ncbi:MBL fold metallo-hydrolase [Pedobacter sp.]|uniref:MBL fold metallo-hydrolase n=1 Tax=Pedobacter sp. TaxID=1411316 RepID=UPI003D7FD220
MSEAVEEILKHCLDQDEAAIWWLGQAGYIIRAAGITVALDPYLSDAAAASAPEFKRLYPPPLAAAALQADIYIVTHDHLDHLDPETVETFRFKRQTRFVAPRLAARKLLALGIDPECLVVVNPGECWQAADTEISGIFALPTGSDVLDTTGYLLRFSNGRSVYHTSDTQFHPLVLAAAPNNPELMLVPINGKWGNPGPEQAVEFAAAVQPRYAIPNHYDMMALNVENPHSFEWFCTHHARPVSCVILEIMQPFVWNALSTRIIIK